MRKRSGPSLVAAPPLLKAGGRVQAAAGVLPGLAGSWPAPGALAALAQMSLEPASGGLPRRSAAADTTPCSGLAGVPLCRSHWGGPRVAAAHDGNEDSYQLVWAVRGVVPPHFTGQENEGGAGRVRLPGSQAKA